MKIACTFEEMILELVVANEIKNPVENNLYIWCEYMNFILIYGISGDWVATN